MTTGPTADEQSAPPVSAAPSLVLVATPIGNLSDLSARALEVLARADTICCEDTRRTRALLSATGLPAGVGRLLSLHEHNERSRIPQVLARLAQGQTVAVVTDAGTPGISDPGSALVAAAIEAGVLVTAVPGPSAVVMALIVSGLPTDRFCMEGFLPKKGGDRTRRLAALVAEERTTVILEAPGRLAQTLVQLAEALGDRPVAVARELTKLHEEVWRGTLPAAAATFGRRDVRGEVVIVLGGASPPGPVDDQAVEAAVRQRLIAGDGPRQAAVFVAEALGVPRRRAYETALDLRDDR